VTLSLIDLRKKYSGKKCLVLGCGPSLKDLGATAIRELSQEYTVVTIKQSYLQFKDLSDFQFFNCNNFMNYPNQRAKFVCCSPFPLEYGRRVVWGNQKIDHFYQIKDNRKLSSFDSLEEYFNPNFMGSFRGPGIMYEIVLPFVYNLEFSEILTSGWDYYAHDGYVEHFYPEVNRKKLKNPADVPYKGENQESIENSAKVQNFLFLKGIKLRCIKSDKCFLDPNIERVVL